MRQLEDHPHTGFVMERDGLSARYLIDDIDAGGVRCRRAPIDELGHEEYLTWNEFARMVLKRTIRVYGYTDDEMGITEDSRESTNKEKTA